MLVTVNEAIELIREGKSISFSGDENLLKQLPKGEWIGGTIPYFMDINGGIFTKEKLFADEISLSAKLSSIKSYGEDELHNIPDDADENGFSIIIIPASSKVHLSFAQNAPNYPDIFLKPIIGWIAGVDLNDLNKITPKVIDGTDRSIYENKALVMHFSLPSDKIATIGIVNLFKQGEGCLINFPKGGFSATDCSVDGKNMNFSDFLINNNIDIKLPLVANYFGTMVNVSFQQIVKEKKRVDFFAPVFTGVEYRIASPVGNYVKEFGKIIPQDTLKTIFSCNCILNYLYCELEGKNTGNLFGPMTFGEIAYQLLNQTLVFLEIKEI